MCQEHGVLQASVNREVEASFNLEGTNCVEASGSDPKICGCMSMQRQFQGLLSRRVHSLLGVGSSAHKARAVIKACSGSIA